MFHLEVGQWVQLEHMQLQTTVHPYEVKRVRIRAQIIQANNDPGVYVVVLPDGQTRAISPSEICYVFPPEPPPQEKE